MWADIPVTSEKNDGGGLQWLFDAVTYSWRSPPHKGALRGVAIAVVFCGVVPLILTLALHMGGGPKVDDRTTAVIPRDRALQLFLAGGNLRGASSKADFAKLANLDRRYKAAKAPKLAAAA